MAAGGSVSMVTFTLRHYLNIPLDQSVRAVREGWSAVTASNRKDGWRADRRQADIAGWVKTIETTYGQNGWHHHCHLLLLHDCSPDEVAIGMGDGLLTIDRGTGEVLSERQAVVDSLYSRWEAAIVATGMPAPSRKHGIHVLVPSRGDEAAVLAAYVAKVDYALGGGVSLLRDPVGTPRSASKLGWEIAYGAHGKFGRNGSLTPLQIAADAVTDGSPTQAKSRALWREYLTATAGVRHHEWSRNSTEWPDIRGLYGTRDDRSDEEILDHRETGAVGLGYVVAAAWWRLITKRHDLLQELRDCETSGDLRRLLDRDDELRLHPLWHVESTAAGWLPRTDLPPILATDP